ncbi:FecR family protein [Variovorax sp. LT1R16]|uniref:FecR family protein n=1 Tax=Variovorax sp. LT1R16 TaxID=3443728 RepID=UPI003F45D0BE
MNTGAPDRSVQAEALRTQARAWLRLLASENVSTADAEAFKRWLGTSTAHKTAFSEVKHRWAVMKPAAGEYLRSHPHATTLHGTASGTTSLGRRALLGGAVSAAALGGVAVMYPPGGRWPSPTEWTADDRTAVGEQRLVALNPQATVVLNTQTSIRRQSEHGSIIGIDLIKGEAAIDLGNAVERFTVVAGAGRSMADRGRFEVRHLQGKVCVTCVEGVVRIEHPLGARTLQAHQQAVYDAVAVSGVATVQPEEIAAWRRGELVFNEARLVDVLAEINRYRVGHVMLLNDATREQRVTGRFLITALDAALSQLENSFDLNARSLPGGLLVLS